MSTNKEGPFNATECSFCGEPIQNNEGGQWHTDPGIFCCPKCAIDALPKLIADSIIIPLDNNMLADYDDPVMDQIAEVGNVLVHAVQLRLWRRRREIEGIQHQIEKAFGPRQLAKLEGDAK